ncbi:ATPase [Mycolicibacterium sp.]|uniref:ATPase n=1 Tax=Mycolicibacterium sp. TaxID=2320850 RepID=UPI0037CA2835
MTSEVVFIGGRSGTGKTSTGFEMHAMLSVAGVAHCLIDGDFLDMAHPAPPEHQLAEQNLAAMWANYRAVGHRRLIYTNAACVLPDVVNDLTYRDGRRSQGSHDPAHVHRRHGSSPARQARDRLDPRPTRRVECPDGHPPANRRRSRHTPNPD